MGTVRIGSTGCLGRCHKSYCPKGEAFVRLPYGGFVASYVTKLKFQRNLDLLYSGMNGEYQNE